MNTHEIQKHIVKNYSSHLICFYISFFFIFSRISRTQNQSPFLLLLCTYLFLASISFAQVTVDNVIVHLAVGERPVHNVIVGNSSNNPAYVAVSVEEVPHPETSQDTVPSTDLLASPKTFSIEPNGTRTVRLLLKTPPTDKERVYRVSFAPQDRGFGEEVVRSEPERKAVIRVLTGMGILVFADPQHPQPELKWDRIGDRVIFKNSGNINFYLSDGEACPTPHDPKSHENCTKLPTQRVYGGSTFEVKAPPAYLVTYVKNDGGGGDFQNITIPPSL